MTRSRVFAASPRSASQTSPGCRLIEQVEDLLFSGARAHQIEDLMVGEFDNLCHALSYLSRRFRLPLAQSGFQGLNQGIHGEVLPGNQFSAVRRRAVFSGSAVQAPPNCPKIRGLATTNQSAFRERRVTGGIPANRRYGLPVGGVTGFPAILSPWSSAPIRSQIQRD